MKLFVLFVSLWAVHAQAQILGFDAKPNTLEQGGALTTLDISFIPRTSLATGAARQIVLISSFDNFRANAATFPLPNCAAATATVAGGVLTTLTINIPPSCPDIPAGQTYSFTVSTSTAVGGTQWLAATNAAPAATTVSYLLSTTRAAAAVDAAVAAIGYITCAAADKAVTSATISSPIPSSAGGASLLSLTVTFTPSTALVNGDTISLTSNVFSILNIDAGAPTAVAIVTGANGCSFAAPPADFNPAANPRAVRFTLAATCLAGGITGAFSFTVTLQATATNPPAGNAVTFDIWTSKDLRQVQQATGYPVAAATAVSVNTLVPGSIEATTSISPLVITFRPATTMPTGMVRTITITPNVPLFAVGGVLNPANPVFSPVMTVCAANLLQAAGAVPAGGALAVLTVTIVSACGPLTAGALQTITFTNAAANPLLLTNPIAGIPVVLSVTTNIDTAPVPVTYVSAVVQTVTSFGPVVPSTTAASTAVAQAKPSINLWFTPRDVMPSTVPRVITLVSSPIAIWDATAAAIVVPVGGCTGTTAGTPTSGGASAVVGSTLTLTIAAGTTCQISGNSLISIPNTLVLANPTTNQDITIGLSTSLSALVRTVYAYSVGSTVGQITSITSVIPNTLAENAALDSLTISFTPASKLIAGNSIILYSNQAFTTIANIPTSIFTPSSNNVPASTTTTGCTLAGTTDVNARLTVAIAGANCNIAAGSVFTFRVTGGLGANPVAGTLVTFDISTSLDMRPLTTTATQGYTTTADSPVASLGLSWTLTNPTAIQVGQPLSSLIVTFAPLTAIGSSGARTITISSAPSVFTPNVVVNPPSIAILTPAGQDASCGASGRTDSNGNVTLTLSGSCTLTALTNYQINLGGLLASNPLLVGTLQSIPIIVTLYTSADSRARSVFGYNAIQPSVTATAKQITSIGSIVPTSTVQGAVLNGMTISFTPSSTLGNGSTISINSNNADPIFPLAASNIPVAVSTGATACTAIGATTAFRVLTITLRDSTGVCTVSGLTTLTVSGLNGVNPAQSGNAITFDISTSADNTPLSTTSAQSYSTTPSSPPSAAQQLRPFAALFVTIISWLFIA